MVELNIIFCPIWKNKLYAKRWLKKNDINPSYENINYYYQLINIINKLPTKEEWVNYLV